MRAFGKLFERGSLKQDTYLSLLTATAVIAGVFFRFWDLGGAPLAVDEYFLGTSTLNIAARGLPEYDCGGYYTRGLLLQYLALPLLKFGASLEFAVRFWPAVASILSIFAVWRIAEMAGGRRTALVAVFLTSLSLWEVEFARFGRMYAPFQAAFLWYIYFQIQHLVKARDPARWWYLCISAVTILIYEGAALLIVFNFLALIWPGRRWTITHLVVAFGLLAAAFAYFTERSKYPELTGDELSSSIVQAKEALSEAISVPMPAGFPELPETLLLVAVAGTCLFALGIWRYYKKLNVNHPSAIFWFSTLLCFCTGFVAFGIALVFAGWLFGLPSPLRAIDMRARSLIGWVVALLAVWVAVLFISFVLGGTDTQSSVKDALRYVLDFPDVYYKVVAPWMQVIPATTLMLAILAMIALNLTLRGRLHERPEAAVVAYLFGASILLVLLVAILPQPYETSRYTYFLYPLLIIVASVGLSGLAVAQVAKPGPRLLLVVALTIPIFVFAEDFRLTHLFRVNEPEIRYRIEYDLPLASHYYLRWDYRGAAYYVNERLAPNDSIIVFDQPFPHYLIRTSGIFIREGTRLHQNVAACNDERDLWSNSPLLDQEGEVREMIEKTEGRVWLMVRSDRYPFRDPLEWTLAERYGLTPEFISQDGYLAVFMIPDKP